MGKGSNRRQFNKKGEEAFKKNHKKVFGTSKSKSSSPSRGGSKTTYVVRNGKLIPKPPKDHPDFKIEEIPRNETFAKFVDSLNERQLRQLARAAVVSST